MTRERTMAGPEALRFKATERAGEVSALLQRPEKARWLLVFAHGAGTGMKHAFMQAQADRLAARGIATLRYQFPYMEKRSGRPDPQPVLLATVRAAVACAAEHMPGVPLLAGGKSMGGRMTSNAASEEPLRGVRGLVFFGFPLHPTGRPDVVRAEHLTEVHVPMLFLQGTRDSLADLDLLTPVCDRLGARAALHVIEGADHSFHVRKSTGRSDDEVLDELADTVNGWAERLALASH
jgi:predicted alpha/beta-hydrolase family hydrolase